MYKIKSGIRGSTAVWSIVNKDGAVVASLHGSFSGGVALAACEALNKGFEYDGWTQRLSDLLVTEVQAPGKAVNDYFSGLHLYEVSYLVPDDEKTQRAEVWASTTEDAQQRFREVHKTAYAVQARYLT